MQQQMFHIYIVCLYVCLYALVYVCVSCPTGHIQGQNKHQLTKSMI